MSPIGLHLCYAYCVDIDCISYIDIDIAYRVACILHIYYSLAVHHLWH